MVWSAPMTAVANSTFTAAQFNQYVRDNLNETAPAKATGAGSYFVGAGANSIAERRAVSVTDNNSGTSTSVAYADLAAPAAVGPAVTVTHGPQVLVIVRAAISNTTTGSARMGYVISGANSLAATDQRGIHIFGSAGTNIGVSDVSLVTALTPGTSTFTSKYRVSAGTGSFDDRRIIVVPF